jgi:hypothetical protein
METDWLVMLIQGKALFSGPARDLLDRRSELVVEAEEATQLDLVARIANAAGYTVTPVNGSLWIAFPRDWASELNRRAREAGAMGMLIAVLTRSTGAAVGIALAYVLVPEGVIAVVWRDRAEWLPVHVFNYLAGSTVPAAFGLAPPQGYTAALGVSLLWMAGFVLVSAVAFRRQDVSA